jgi:hypothetical protein
MEATGAFSLLVFMDVLGMAGGNGRQALDTPPSSFSAAASAVLVAPAWRMWPSGGCDTLLSDQLLQAALGEPNVHIEESHACPDDDAVRSKERRSTSTAFTTFA